MKSLLCALSLFASLAFAETGEVTPKFAWPTQGKVAVKEKSLKKGHRAVTAYHLNFKPDGEKLIVRYSDFHFVSLDGIPASDPRMAEVKKIEKLTAKALPEFVISREGHFIDLANVDAIAAGIIPLAKDKDEVKKVLDNPQARKAIVAKAGELWLYWVDFWSAVSIQNGKPLVNVPTGFMLFDSYNPAASKVEYLGKCKASPGCIELSLTMSVSGADGAKMMQSGMESVGAKGVAPESAAIEKFIKVKIDAPTLRPFEVLTRTTLKMVQDKKAMDGIEEHEYAFDWK